MDDKDFDVVIIGSGAGGGTSAWALSKAGLKVLVLEAGPRYNPFKDYKLHRDDWEHHMFPHKIPVEKRQTYAPMQKLDAKWKHLRSWNHLNGQYNPKDVRVSYGYHHVVGVGGSSLHFTGEAHRLNPASMQMKTRFSQAADWPMTYADLEPYYQQAEEVVGVAGPNTDSSRPRSKNYPQQQHALSYTSQEIKQATKKLGMTFVPNALAVLSQPKAGRTNCNYCGGCLRGCPRTDKGSIDVTYLRDAETTGLCEIRSSCSVTQLEAGANDQITAVHYTDQQGTQRLKTQKVILACGAIETPRLLLNSKNSFAPDGLANESGQVGKNFMETILWTSSGLHPEPLGSHRGLPVDSICWDYNKPDSIPGVIGGCRFSPSQAESDLVGPISYANRIVGGWGKPHKEAMKQSFGRLLSISGIGESLPNAKSFVELDVLKKDKHGLPLAKIHSHLNDNEIRRIEFMANKCREILKATGVKKPLEEFSSYDIFSSTHVFGTCRMGNNEGDSVVDSDCKSHRWKNLWVMDASVFPSSGGGESPGLTIQALALRACEKLVNDA